MRDKYSFSTTTNMETLPRYTEQQFDSSIKTIENDKQICGWFCYRPNYLQKFRTAKWALFWLCCAGAMQGMVVNGFINVVITTIEKRFGLTSSQSGLIAGGYDIASFLLLVPVSYFGGRLNASKPKYIGVGVFILGIGSLLFASPHFLPSSKRDAQNQKEIVCHRNVTSFVENTCDKNFQVEDIESNSDFYLMIFLLAQLLHGAGAAPFFTLGVTYIDENVSKKMSSVYLGIYYTMAVIGPAMGYVIGGELLKIYADIHVDVQLIGMTPESPQWIGAWWIGFVAASVVCFAIAIPILAFPVSLPGSEDLAKEKVSEAHKKSSSSTSKTEAFTKIHQLPRASIELLSNPAFSMLNLAGASEGFLISGFAAFLPKLIENQFSVSASFAALLMGLVTVPAGGGGTFIGGYLIKRWNLQCSGILKFCIFSTAACLIFTMCFALSCPNLAFAGLNVPYLQSNDLDSGGILLENVCNKGCGCSTTDFHPICGIDGITYYSPCYAGCHIEIKANDYNIYKNCTCIDNSTNNSTININEEIIYDAMNTKCSTSCKYLWLFIVLSFCNMLMTFLCTMPALAGTLRVVRDEQSSFALGLQWMIVRLLGTIPAPIIFGALIDDTCILWQDTCQYKETGSCLIYDNYYMSLYMLGLAFLGKTASLVFFTLSWWFYNPPSRSTTNQLATVEPGL